MNRVQPIYDTTEKILTILQKEITATHRQQVIDEINELLLEREKHMQAMSEPFTDEEKELGKKLLPLNEKIQEKMNFLFNELKVEMKQVKKQKRSNRKYINPYENVQTMDGMFMDKKK